MATDTVCRANKKNGQPCSAPRLRNSEFCFWHSPEHAKDVVEAGRLGGLRRRREKAVSGAYDFDGLESIKDIRRVLEIAILDTLGLENSIARARALIAGALAAAKLVEVGELEDRVQRLEESQSEAVGS